MIEFPKDISRIQQLLADKTQLGSLEQLNADTQYQTDMLTMMGTQLSKLINEKPINAPMLSTFFHSFNTLLLKDASTDDTILGKEDWYNPEVHMNTLHARVTDALKREDESAMLYYSAQCAARRILMRFNLMEVVNGVGKEVCTKEDNR